MKKEQEKILEEKKQIQTLNKEKLKQHSIKYKSLLKEKEDDRKKKAKYKIE